VLCRGVSFSYIYIFSGISSWRFCLVRILNNYVQILYVLHLFQYWFLSVTINSLMVVSRHCSTIAIIWNCDRIRIFILLQFNAFNLFRQFAKSFSFQNPKKRVNFRNEKTVASNELQRAGCVTSKARKGGGSYCYLRLILPFIRENHFKTESVTKQLFVHINRSKLAGKSP
jgi:hypothetical protein